MKPVLFIPHGDSLTQAINELLSLRYRENSIFKERYLSDEKSSFAYEMDTSSLSEIQSVNGVDIYLIGLLFDI